jgi:hypothetical protein
MVPATDMGDHNVSACLASSATLVAPRSRSCARLLATVAHAEVAFDVGFHGARHAKRRAEQTIRESEITARQVQLFRVIQGVGRAR